MQITYHKGPQNNVFCKLILKNEKLLYDIHGIRKRGRLDREDRFDLLLQIIARNPEILHTHLILLAQKLGKNIAKRTIENDLNHFEKEGLLESEKSGDSKNARRSWSLKVPESDLEKWAKKEVKEIVTLVEKYVVRIEKIYSKFNESEKAWAMRYLLHVIQDFQPIIEICDQDFKIKKKKKQFQKVVTRAYDILKNEPRDYRDGRPILRRLLHLAASKPMIDMNEFLEEIK